MPSRRSRYKPKKPLQNQACLPEGRDISPRSPARSIYYHGATRHSRIITCDRIPTDGTVKTILIYWDRGDLRGGDEALQMASLRTSPCTGIEVTCTVRTRRSQRPLTADPRLTKACDACKKLKKGCSRILPRCE
jgi:hypothetical protein